MQHQNLNHPLHQQHPAQTYYYQQRPNPTPVHPHQQPYNQPTFIQGHPRTERIMYHSTIQPHSTTHQSSPAYGLGRLEAMGRFIKEEPQEQKTFTENTAVFHQQKSAPLTFRTNHSERPKMASSVIFFNKNSQPHTHAFSFNNVPKRQPQQQTSTGFESLLSKARTVKEQQVLEGPQEKKHRENIGIQHFNSMQNHQQPYNLINQSQKVWKSQIIGQGMSFEGQFPPKNPKRYEFYRNTGATSNKMQFKQIKKQPSPVIEFTEACKSNLSNVGVSNRGVQKNKESRQENLIEKDQALNVKAQASFKSSENSNSTIINPPLENNGMFKKKCPYSNSNENGKTDQNLLKMLGINLKKNTHNQVLSSKTSDHLNINTSLQKAIEVTFPDMKHTVSNEVRPKSSCSPKIFKKSDFKIGKKMGKGQFGEVMLVQHKQTGFICGMKVMNKRQIKLQKYQNQIARQLSIQFYLSHRNIAPLYGYFEDQQNVYLLVQFCSDGQLLQMLRKNRRMEEADVSPIIRQICEGLDYVHKEEIIHRDVKPENILFNFGTVKISDFGWAVHCGNGMRRTVSGSPLYYSPEIVLETAYDQKIDLWAIGMMTYECLLGKIPFRIYSQLDLNRIVEDEINFPEYVDVSDEAKDFILRIMKKKPQERMEMRQILRHPFITKYQRQKKVSAAILEEFRNILRI